MGLPKRCLGQVGLMDEHQATLGLQWFPLFASAMVFQTPNLQSILMIYFTLDTSTLYPDAPRLLSAIAGLVSLTLELVLLPSRKAGVDARIPEQPEQVQAAVNTLKMVLRTALDQTDSERSTVVTQ